MLIIGEIDCREGLLVAVERGKYSTVQEAMSANITQFMDVITYISKVKQFQVICCMRIN